MSWSTSPTMRRGGRCGSKEPPPESALRRRAIAYETCEAKKAETLSVIPLRPRAAWEKVAEGRMRALSLTEKGISRAFLLRTKSPHPPYRAPSPILADGRGGKLEIVRLSQQYSYAISLPARARENMTFNAGGHVAYAQPHGLENMCI